MEKNAIQAELYLPLFHLSLKKYNYICGTPPSIMGPCRVPAVPGEWGVSAGQRCLRGVISMPKKVVHPFAK